MRKHKLKVGDFVKVIAKDDSITTCQVGKELCKLTVVLELSDDDYVTVVAENGWDNISFGVKSWTIRETELEKVDIGDNKIMTYFGEIFKQNKIVELAIETMASDILKNYSEFIDLNSFVHKYIIEAKTIINRYGGENNA